MNADAIIGWELGHLQGCAFQLAAMRRNAGEVAQALVNMAEVFAGIGQAACKIYGILFLINHR